jgi:hypothetical protein
MKRLLVIFIIFLAGAPFVFSGDVFFPAKKGMVLLTANLNSNSRVESYNLLTVKEISESGNNMTVTYNLQILDKNRKPSDKSPGREYSVNILNGVLMSRIDTIMDSFFAEKKMKYTITTGSYPVPSDMTAGTRIEDTWMKMIVSVPVIGDVTADVAITNIRCTGIEAVTVPAGTFEACKVTQTVTTTTKGWGQSKIVNTRATWYVKGIGVVKSINYDEKGKVDTVSELYELRR